MLWVVFSLLVFIAVISVSAPLFRREQAGARLGDVDAYAALLSDIDRDLERGLLTRREAEETRTEIARRLLKAREKAVSNGITAQHAGLRANVIFAGVAGFTAISSMGLYLAFGQPDLPSHPLTARLNAPAEQQSIDVLIARVEQRLSTNPDDGMGWAVLAPVYFKQGQFERAAEAYTRSMALLGESPEKLLGFAEAKTYATGGVVTKDAAEAFQKALRNDPTSLRARFWLAVRVEQEGNKTEAEKAFRAIVADESIPEGWRRVINERLAKLQSSGAPAATASAAPQEQTPSAQGPAGSRTGPPPEFVRNMVESLAGRLREDGSDLDGWLMLMRSYAVIGEMDKARDAHSTARANFTDQPAALQKLDEMAKSLGLAS